MIRTETIDGKYILIAPRGLDFLIRQGQVKKFWRSSGWAEIGKDPIRGSAQNSTYSGPERRHNS